MAGSGVRSLEGRPTYVPGEILLKLKDDAAPNDRARALSAMGEAHALRRANLYKIRLRAGQDVRQAVEKMKNDPSVEYAQPNYRYYALGCSPPTDTYYVSPEYWPFQKISAPQAWALFTTCPPGSASVTVAVLDSGISRFNPDLKGVALDGLNAICDVQEEAATCTCGAAVSDSAGVTATMDDFGHGTYVAGIIGASWGTDNQESGSSYYPDCDSSGGSTPYSGVFTYGFAGLSPGITLLAVKILDCTGAGTTDSIVEGTDFAVSMGARVLNYSLGSSPTGGIDPAEQEALDNALANNCVIVASAGNESGPGNLAPVDFPAAYPPVISVGATDENDNVADYSNGGINLKMVAPGGAGIAFTGNAITDSANKVFSDFLSPLPIGSVGTQDSCGFEPVINTPATDPNFGVAAGTSAAAPFVSATAALILSMYPNLNNTQVVDRIIDNTDSLDGNSGWGAQTGYGRLNVYRAVTNINPNITNYVTTFNSPNPFYPDVVGTTNITLAITQPEPVELRIYDTGGELVYEKSFSASQLNNNPSNPQFKSFYIPWNGRNGAGQEVVTGVYFYSVGVNGQVGRNKIVVIRGNK